MKIYNYICLILLVTISLPKETSAQRWTSKTPHPLDLKYFTISQVNDKLYSIGGFTTNWLSNVYEYDPSLNSWTQKTRMPNGYFFVKSAVVNDKIYVFGYNGIELTVFEYDPSLNSWITKNGKTGKRYTFCVASYNNKIYVIGGRGSSGITGLVEEYDPVLDTWQTKTPMPTARQSVAAVEYNGKIYVAGGNDSNQLLSTFEVYDPVLDLWTSKPSMLTPRKELELQAVEGNVYAMGGSDSVPLTTVEEYNINSETWVTTDSMLTPRESFASGVVNNIIYAVGGQSTASLTNANEAFNASQPGSPTGVITQSGDLNVLLTWNMSTDSDLLKYVIYRSVNDGFSPLPADSIGFSLIPDTTFSDSTVFNGIIYYYRLSAVDSSGNISAFSSQVSAFPHDLTAPAAPDNLVGLPAKNVSNLSWSANSESDLKQYNIYRNLSPGFTPSSSDSVGFVLKPDSTFSDSSLANGTTYYYQIAALDSSLNLSSFSNEVSVTPADLVAPAAPSNLTATGKNESINLAWDLSPDADVEKYIIYRSQTDGFAPQPSDSLSFVNAADSTYSDSSVTVGLIYYYRVSAIDSVLNESAFSNQASAIPIDTVAPAIPQNLSAVVGANRYIDLSWDANTEPDLTDYIIYRSLVNDFSPSSSDSIAIVSSPTVTYRDSGLVIDSTYYYKIAAIDTAYNYSGFSTQDFGTVVDTTPPNAPQNVTAADGPDNVLLEWDQNTEADLLKYTIYRSITPGFSPAPGDSLYTAASTDSAFTDTSAAVGITYYYRISASDSLNQESSFSNEASATPFDPLPPAAPTNLIASAGNAQVSLIWDLNAEADMDTYIIYRSLTPGFTPESSDSIGVNTHPDTTFTDINVFNNTTYYYKIAATDTVNNLSAFSNEASATPVPLLDYPWQIKAVMTTARFASASAAYDGKIYVAGGRDGTGPNAITEVTEEYDPVTNSWAAKTDMLTTREDFAGDILFDRFYVVGGEASNANLTLVEAYRPTTDSWETMTSMSSERRGLSVTSMNGLLYAIGGRRQNTGYRDDVEEFDPVNDVWVNRTIMPTTRFAHASTALNNKIYVVGGDNGSYLGTLEVYDQSTDSWSTLTSMPTPRSNLTFNTIAGRLYAIGGEDATGSLSVVEIYDPGTNSWATGDTMLTARYDHSSVVIDDVKLYAIGGYDGTAVLNANEVYDPPPWKPLNLQATPDASTVTLTWDANIEPDLDYYVIYRDTTDGFTPGSANILESVTNGIETYSDTDVQALTTYYYKISAVDTVGQESRDFSNQASVLTPNLAFSLASLDSTFTNGDTVIIDLTFFGNYNTSTVTSFQFTMNFDSTQINGIGIDTVGFGSSAMIVSNALPGQLKIAAAILDTLRGSNKVMQIILEVDDDAQLGTSTVSFSDAFFNEGIPVVDLTSTSISIRPRYGDVSANSIVNSYDASLVLQNVVGIEEFSTGRQAKADVTYNGSVTALDAYYILLKSAGLISTFPVEDSLFSKISAADNPNINISILKQIATGGNITKFTFSTAEVNNISSFYTEFNYNKNNLKFKRILLSEEYSDYLNIVNIQNGNLKFAMTGYNPGKNSGELLTIEFENLTIGNTPDNTDINNLIIQINEQYIQPDYLKSDISGLPDKFDLAQNYPNPFNPGTTIKYQLPERTPVLIVIYNILGQEVRTLVNEAKDTGFYSIKWDGRNNFGKYVGSGVYIYRIKAGKFILTRKMLLIK
ncbi:kelch repeat-containing protein [candidate division KSB1 bacterium]